MSKSPTRDDDRLSDARAAADALLQRSDAAGIDPFRVLIEQQLQHQHSRGDRGDE